MKTAAIFLMFVLWMSNTHGQQLADDLIEFSITSAYAPEDLDALIQRLKNRGVRLEFTETGYCNGRLRVLYGAIEGQDGQRVQFETRALRQATFRLRIHARELGVHGVRIKKGWKRCLDADATSDKPEVPTELPSLRTL
jgi:hypothetical protein